MTDAYRFCCGNLTERGHLEDPGVDEKIILKQFFKKWDGDMDWINLAPNLDRQPALVNAVTHLRVIS